MPMLLELVSKCLPRCSIISLDNWTVMGDLDDGKYDGGCIPPLLFETIAARGRRMQSLSINNCALPTSKPELSQCVRGIMDMSELTHLVLNSKVYTLKCPTTPIKGYLI